MTHAADMVHYLLDDHFPSSTVAQGGVYAWRDGRENADTFQALLEYPQCRLERAALAQPLEHLVIMIEQERLRIVTGGELEQQLVQIERRHQAGTGERCHSGGNLGAGEPRRLAAAAPRQQQQLEGLQHRGELRGRRAHAACEQRQPPVLAGQHLALVHHENREEG